MMSIYFWILSILWLITLCFALVWHQRLSTLRKEKQKLEKQIQNAKHLSTLTGGIAHDFNNILGSILGFSFILEEDLIRHPELKEIAEQISIAAKRGQNIILQIMRYGRQDVEGDENMKRIASLDNIVQETISLISPSLKKSVQVHYKNETKDDSVLCDPTQMTQVILNLCINANHAIGVKAGDIHITLKHMDISNEFQHDGIYTTMDTQNKNTTILYNGYLTAGKYICLSITDNGQGMTKKIAEQIFNPFFTTKEDKKGTGLGLAALQGIVHDHNGAIRLTTTPLVGSCFEIFLPCPENITNTF